MKIAPSLFCLLFPLSLLSQNIWRVDAASTTTNPNGLTWLSAFSDLHQALAVAQSGDEVWIAKGIYKPTSDSDRFAVFNLPSGVALYGGFNGTETQRDQRDWIAHPTILSGDIGIPSDREDNSYGIIYALNTNDLTRMDGLTVEEGNANNDDIFIPYNSPTRSGGGIYLDGKGQSNSAQMLIYNCIFRHNRASYAGGCVFADGRDGGEAFIGLNNCVFQQNKAPYGAGFAVENTTIQSKPLEVIYCVFNDNVGSAAWMNTFQEVTFSDCSFSKNIQPSDGVVRIEGENKSHTINFQRCDFIENTPGNAGTISVSLRNSVEDIPLNISHCRFYGNLGFTAFIYGGTNLSGRYRVSVDNCIFHLNYSTSPNFNLANFAKEDEAWFTNCIFQGQNTPVISRSPLTTKPTRIFNSIFISDIQNVIISGEAFVDHCIFSEANCGQVGINTTCGSNNLFATDPLFVNLNPTPDADFHLRPCSPALNMGDNSILDSLDISTDFDDNPRIRYGRVDIGPFETSLFFDPVTITEPACHGASDGIIDFGGSICAPFTVMWDGGSATVASIENLAAGVYHFTVTDANGLTLVESVAVSEPEPVQVVLADMVDISCFGYSDGMVALQAYGGTPPYLYPPDSQLTDLSAGLYDFTVTDASGCMGVLESIVLLEPSPLQIGYSVQNASGPNIADGAIWIDTVFGGVGGTVTPPDLTNLLPGTYTITATDANNCFATETIEVGYTVRSGEPTFNFQAKVYPNPAYSGETVFVEILEHESSFLSIFDFHGKLLKQMVLIPNAVTSVAVDFPAGLYQIEIRGDSDKRTMLRWVVQ